MFTAYYKITMAHDNAFSQHFKQVAVKMAVKNFSREFLMQTADTDSLVYQYLSLEIFSPT